MIPKLNEVMNCNLIAICTLIYTFVLLNVESVSLPQTTQESTIEMSNVSVKVNQSFGNVYDVDVVMQSFLSLPEKIVYFTANHPVIHQALYPEHRQFHSFVQTLIYNNYHCSVSWTELNALFMVFPSETRKKLRWEVNDAFQTRNSTKLFNPCLFKGVRCMLHQNKSSDDVDNQYHDITYVGSYYISAISVNSHGRFYKNDGIMLTIFLNYSLPQYLTAFMSINAKIYGFSFAKMPKDLQSFSAVACIFYSMSSQAFSWNSIPHTIDFIEITESVIDDNSTSNGTWTSTTNFKDIDQSLNLSTNFDDLEFIPTWYKPKLKHFVIRDFENFRNDPNSFNVNQFLLHIRIIAPSLNKIHLNILDLNGFVYIEQVNKALNPDSRSTKISISLLESGLDMIGYGAMSCGMEVDLGDSIDEPRVIQEMQRIHVFETFEQFFKCQQLMLDITNQSSGKYGVNHEHKFLSYDDVMEGYSIYQEVLKNDAEMNNSFHTIVNFENHEKQTNDSIGWIVSHHSFVRHCVLTEEFQKTESHSQTIVFWIIVVTVFFAIVGLVLIEYV